MSRSDSRLSQFQQRVPSDLLPAAVGRVAVIRLPAAQAGGAEEVVNATVGKTSLRFSLRTSDPALTKRRQAAAVEQVEQLWAALRAGPVSLSHKQQVAFSGLIYKAWRASLEEDPVLSPEEWTAVAEHVADARRGGIGAELSIPLPDGSHLSAAVQATLERMFGKMVDSFLIKEGLILETQSRSKLMLQVALVMQEQAERAAKQAGGDYRADDNLLRFPVWERPSAVTKETRRGPTFTSLFDDYVRITKVRPKTATDYRRTFTEEFATFIEKRAGHADPSRVTISDVVAWRDALLEGGLTPKTVKDKKVAAVKAIYGRAVRDAKLSDNPAAGVEVVLDKPIRERSKGFTEEEAQALLRAAQQFVPGQHSPELVAAIRWTPWLGAYTGARIAELTQLRGRDVRQTAEGWMIHFTPEAGTTKNDQDRTVPVHPHLLELGFIEFVQQSGQGPLFYRSQGNAVSKARADAVAGRISMWARKVVPDPRVQPTHGWRHRFKTIARQVNMSEEKRDYILGHAAQGMNGVYGDMAGLAQEIVKIPRIALAPAPTAAAQAAAD